MELNIRSTIVLISSYILVLSSGFTNSYEVKTHEKVLLVSFDGFRYDYLDTISGLDNFKRLEKLGVRIPFVNNAFATVTFPNHWTIATGLYEESHGIVNNEMYDPILKEHFWRGNNDPKWWRGEPVWITATRQGRKSATYQYPGSEVEIKGYRPDFWVKFNATHNWEVRARAAVRWFTEDNVDVVFLYWDEPDSQGHRYGPNGTETIQAVRETDEGLGLLLDLMEEAKLMDDVNIIVTSDHGMAYVSGEQTIELKNVINMEDVDVLIDQGTFCMIQPHEGKLEGLYTTLKDHSPHMHVYKKEEIPERWHYTHNRRILPILVTMDEGWQCLEELNDWYKIAHGNHGYDNSKMSMKPIFLATGPSFKTNYYMDQPINNVDIYPLICSLLNINEAPNNGSLENTSEMMGVRFAAVRSGCPLYRASVLGHIVTVFVVLLRLL